VGAHVGRAVTSDQVVGINSGELWVSLRPSAPYQSTVADVRRVIRQHQGPELDVAAYPEQRMTDLGQRLDEPIVVRVYGDELPTLRARAEDVRRWLAATDGVVNPQLRTAPEEQTVQVEVDLARAQRFGLKPGDVRRAAATLISGIQVGSIFEEQKIFDVIVVGVPGTREGLDDIRGLLIDTPNGQRVRLEQVADVRVTPAPTAYEHHSVSRFIDVTADVRGRSVDAVAQDVEVVLGGLLLPVGYHAVLLGEYEEARGELITVLVLGAGIAAVIFLLLQAAFQSWRLASVLFAAALAALVGGAAIALADPGTPARSALLALLAVLGLTVRQAVVLVARWERMDRAPDGRPDPAETQRAAVTGLVPVVTTAVVLAAAMLPFVVLGRGAGLEMARSLAVVTLGGLVTSTLVILFVLPPLYLRHAPVRPVGTSEPPPPAGAAAPPTVPGQRLDERLGQRRELTDATP
jgi:Cu/Ag efflux pump CusA